jgi:hypothetical protein
VVGIRLAYDPSDPDTHPESDAVAHAQPDAVAHAQPDVDIDDGRLGHRDDHDNEFDLDPLVRFHRLLGIGEHRKLFQRQYGR